MLGQYLIFCLIFCLKSIKTLLKLYKNSIKLLMPGPEIYWNSDSSSCVRIEFIGDVIHFYYSRKSDNLAQQHQLWHKLCHVPCRDSANEISRAKREGRKYVYWLSGDYFLVVSSINPVSHDSLFDLYYWPVDDNNHVLRPRFIFSVTAEEKSNYIRLCLVPELSRVENTCDLSMRVSPVSGEIEYTESKIQLVAGYDDKISPITSGLGSRCFMWKVINIK